MKPRTTSDSYDDVSYEDVFGDGEPPSPKRSTVPTAGHADRVPRATMSRGYA